MLRERAMIIAIVCSAAVIMLPSGVFITTIPFLLAAGTSTLSRPMPARPITFRLWAASTISAVTLVALLMTRELYWPIMLSNPFGVRSVITSTSISGVSSNIFTPTSDRGSLTRTFMDYLSLCFIILQNPGYDLFPFILK